LSGVSANGTLSTGVPTLVALLVPPELRERLEVLLGERGFAPSDGDDVAAVLVAADAGGPLAAAVAEAHGRFPDVPVVAVTGSAESRDVRAALAAGARGLILEADLEAVLAPCLRSVGAGQVCVPRERWRELRPRALSTREKQILGLVVMGYMNSQIAARLFLAESTVKSHLNSAFGKLGVSSRNEAVSLILDPQRGLGLGILAVGGEPVSSEPVA
jgi:DNA-binding NarL/FixJ family response regulator